MLHRLLLLSSVLVTPVLSAATLVSVTREVQATAMVFDNFPEVFETDADAATSTTTGAFSATVLAHASGNDNFAAADATQQSSVNATTLSFSGSGAVQGTSETHFTDDDGIFESEATQESVSALRVDFTIAKRGKVTLNCTLSASSTGAGSGNFASGTASVAVVDRKTSTVLWSQQVENGAKSASVTVALRRGDYVVLVRASNAGGDAGGGDNLIASSAAFDVSGQISEAR